MQEATRDLLERLEQNANQVAARRREILTVGSFQALLDPVTDLTWVNYAVPVDRQMHAADVRRWLATMRGMFVDAGRTFRFEFTEELWPMLPGLLEEAGLKLEARHPVLICTPESFAPFVAPGVEVQLVDGSETDHELSEYIGAATLCFGGDPRDVSVTEANEFRAELRKGLLRHARAEYALQLAGIGCTTPLNGVAELAGIGTIPVARRRGVATSLSSFLVEDHFTRSGDLAWLSAGDEIARAVYERIGFHWVATRLNYREE